MSDSKRIAFLGLGVMGGPMARHLIARGHTVTAYNRTAARAAAWLDTCEGSPLASIAPSPAVAAQAADVLISCVGNDEDLSEVLRGPSGALAALPSGALDAASSS